MKRLALPIRIAKHHAKLSKNPKDLRLQNRLQNLLNQQKINEQLPTL